MKNMLFIVAIIFSGSVFGDTYVTDYYKSNGTYVKSHYRSDSDSSFGNNWSTSGNVNPYTGKKGYKKAKTYYRYKKSKKSRNLY